VSIQEGTVIGPGAVICTGSRIGRRVHIGPGAVIGHEGFGFSPTPEGLIKIRQVGNVVIEDDVEIGANACIDRGTLGTTRIGSGSKLDNLVQIGHNVRIGREVILAGQTGIAGSTVIEDRAMLGGQSGVADHLTIGANAKVAAKSGVTANVPANAVVAGYPAMPRMRWLRFFARAAVDATDDDTSIKTSRRGKRDRL
jgi:UDP-3-O-[3-hydroxymyristoyl] glucosamine N-acyltransferase